MQIEQFRAENKLKLTATQEEKLNDLINSVQDYAILSAQ
jgi:hypothetical protein